jgi:hypothetical protein
MDLVKFCEMLEKGIYPLPLIGDNSHSFDFDFELRYR